MSDNIALEKVQDSVVLVSKMCISCLILCADPSIVGTNKKGTYMAILIYAYVSELQYCLEKVDQTVLLS